MDSIIIMIHSGATTNTLDCGLLTMYAAQGYHRDTYTGDDHVNLIELHEALYTHQENQLQSAKADSTSFGSP